jgi:regulator of cell morphogenesis and NO signaling
MARAVLSSGTMSQSSADTNCSAVVTLSAIPRGSAANLHGGQAVAAIVLDHPECAAVFQRRRIDFCCRGGQSLDAACEERGVDRQEVLAELNRAVEERAGMRQADPRAMSTAALVAHIVSTHHAYLRQTLPFVRGLAAKVARVHGDHNPRLRALSATVGALGDALLPHLDEEEQSLFPWLMAKGTDPATVETGLRAMREEHLAVGALLERMREESDDYRMPDWGCNSYRTLLAELAALESDTLRHVHLENHVLALRAPVRAAEQR